MSRPDAYITPLAEAGPIASAGGKGANLGELVRGGFPVPEGFAVTTAAYDQFVADNDLSDRAAALADHGNTDAIDTLFTEAALAPELAAAITAAYVAIGEGPVAVRSSATAEDLPGASFAGQQETYLNISGPDAVLAGVRRCWASLWTPRAVAYRAHRGAGDSGTDDMGPLSIAVVVQRLVPADVSGVLFTANPATGRRDETVITAAWGLGESVVGGRVEPDEYVVRTTPEGPQLTVRVGDKQVMTVPTDTGSAEVSTPDVRRHEQTLTDAQALDLAALGGRVAAHFGVPQDIEWVLHDGTFQLVQARAITALPEPTGEVPTEWPVPRHGSLYFRASIVEQMPDPLSPLFADLVRTAVPKGLSGLLGELSPRMGRLDIDFPTINGYAFYDYSRRAFSAMLSLSPGLVRLIGQPGFILDRWRDRELPRYRDAVAVWADRDPATLAAADLVRGAQELLDAGCLYYTTVQTIIPVAATAELTWTALYERALRRPGGTAATDFLLGFDSTPIAVEKSLATLAAWCRTDAGLTAALLAEATDPLGETPPEGVDASVWTQWRARLGAHLSAYGHTTYNLDIMNPVPADDPMPVLQSLRYRLGGTATDPSERQQRQAAERERLTRDLFDHLDPVRTALARRTLASAQHWAPVREDALAAMGLAWPVIRRLVREAGRRMTDAGVLAAQDDVFWLTLTELLDLGPGADDGETLPSFAEQIAARRATWRGQALATPPQYLPESRAMRAWEGFLPAREQDEGPVLTGTTGSGGRVTGHARVLKGPADFASFVPGEILVASITTPAYTPLFAQAAAVVTDVGGVLSHGSIVAREFGLPAVLGTGSATRRITTGDLITVDGIAGQVLLEGAPESEPAKRRSGTLVIAPVAAVVAIGGALVVRAWRR
ncbi:phosphoenolpyruvate synthase [Raineyella antarctica]|uniref:Phosphoenolpyruvate synthase n=1 Tax=Raineyella antarctica TaxID=1577474 RepID=A0A1G6I6S8_9ACTN|nr:PEP/pyruvate-binding domain-containing protein [Raineyella antarctica]SDC02204.1 phosphoenolpyruvate synthase [Raineyella antarctica]